MENSDILKSIWQSQKSSSNIDINNILSDHKSKVIETIGVFEDKERSEKKKQIIATVIVVIAIIIQFTIFTELTTLHFIGLILLSIGLVFSVLLNKTNDFPDLKLLDTLSYLKKYKENTLSRTKRHIATTILSILFVFPGLYLTLRPSLEKLGEVLIPSMIGLVLGVAISLFFWFRDYNKRSKLVLEEVSTILEKFNEDDTDSESQH